MNVHDLLDAPQVDMPTVPGPVDCMPGVLAAGRVAPVVKVDYYGGTVWVLCEMGMARAALTRSLSKISPLAVGFWSNASPYHEARPFTS